MNEEQLQAVFEKVKREQAFWLQVSDGDQEEANRRMYEDMERRIPQLQARLDNVWEHRNIRRATEDEQ